MCVCVCLGIPCPAPSTNALVELVSQGVYRLTCEEGTDFPDGRIVKDIYCSSFGKINDDQLNCIGQYHQELKTLSNGK